MNIITNIKDIYSLDNLLVSTKSFLGETIQEFQRNPYNHVGKLIWVRNILYVCEADKRGICLTPIFEYLKRPDKYKLLVQRPKKLYTENEIDIAYEFVLSRCGHIGYEYLNLLVYQPIKFLTGGKIWIGAKTPHKADRRYICGEWVARVDNITNGWFEGKWERIAPVDLYCSEYYDNYVLNI